MTGQILAVITGLKGVVVCVTGHDLEGITGLKAFVVGKLV